MSTTADYCTSVLKSLEVDYDINFVLDNISLPNKLEDIPNILGWSGPGRSGTTALLFLLAGHPDVNRVYFQPQKTLMRQGGPPVVLSGRDSLICMKETFTGRGDAYDPIEILLRLGVPPEKITWIVMLRDPLQTFSSWRHIEPATPETFAYWQSHTINLYYKYKDSGVKVTPFTYELIKDREEDAIRTLLSKVGLDAQNIDLNFDQAAIRHKLVPGQAADKEFFQQFLSDTIRQGKFAYKTNAHPLTVEMTEEVVYLCYSNYLDFHKLAQVELDL